MLELREGPGLLWASWILAMGRTGRGLYNPPFPVLVLEIQFLSSELSPATHPEPLSESVRKASNKARSAARVSPYGPH